MNHSQEVGGGRLVVGTEPVGTEPFPPPPSGVHLCRGRGRVQVGTRNPTSARLLRHGNCRESGQVRPAQVALLTRSGKF